VLVEHGARTGARTFMPGAGARLHAGSSVPARAPPRSTSSCTAYSTSSRRLGRNVSQCRYVVADGRLVVLHVEESCQQRAQQSRDRVEPLDERRVGFGAGSMRARRSRRGAPRADPGHTPGMRVSFVEFTRKRARRASGRRVPRSCSLRSGSPSTFRPMTPSSPLRRASASRPSSPIAARP